LVGVAIADGPWLLDTLLSGDYGPSSISTENKLSGHGGTSHFLGTAYQCSANTRRTGERCRQPARKGQTVCQLHGGNSPQALKAADRRLGEIAVLEKAHQFGRPADIGPADAQYEELRRSVGHVRYLEKLLAETGPDTALLTVYYQERTMLLKTLNQSRDLDERRLIITGKSIDILEQAVTATLADLGLNTDVAAVREALARNLRGFIVVDDDDDDTVIAGEVIEPWEAAEAEWIEAQPDWHDGPVEF